ncbi:MAG: WS/DGAT domain-containing protein, partial [Myxococcota bacterium]|nr:WS/DGAT domain-containing protein [Myxococcota bacterium]
HCMIDGSSGVDLGQIMMTTTPDRSLPEVPPYIPRPRPSRSDLLLDEFWRRASLPLRAFNGMRTFADETDDLLADVSSRAKILWETIGTGLTPSETPMNGPPSHHRKFDWLEVELDDIKALRRGLDCSVNDVVLTVVTGAVREFMLLRGVDPALIPFKISAPVSVRKEEEKGKLGNRVSSWIIELPISEPDPTQQLEEIRAVTRNLKETNQALGISMIMKVAEWTPASLLSLGSQATNGPINSIVTNVPGPQFPLYLQGAKLLSVFPQVPLLGEMGVGIALMSYNGRICWGFNANPDIIPDLDVFVDQIRVSLDRLTDLCAKQSRSSADNQNTEEESPPVKAIPVRSEPSGMRTQRNGSKG